MIYLFDEKKGRRQDYGWTDEKVASFRNVLRLYDSYDFIEDMSLLKGKCNIVFLHESFFDGVSIGKKKQAKDILRRIEAQTIPGNIKLVVFSGSKMSRKIDGNIAYMPVSVFYQNLDFFIHKYTDDNWTLDDILYGKNKLLEQKILENIRSINKSIVKEDNSFSWNHPSLPKSLFVKNIVPKLDKPSFFQTDEIGIFYDLKSEDPISDLFLHNFINEKLSKEKFEKLYIPLCFGPTLSDYNGLRLALHIRTTEGPNQFSAIYIYSPVEMIDLLDNEYFDILKTDEIYLIDYSCNSLYDSLLNQNNTEKDSIRKSLSKIQLQPPKNYIDSHSIANEWAIYRWSQTLGVDIQDKEIDSIIGKIKHSLYFKYLKTLYNPQNSDTNLSLKINGITDNMNCENHNDPRILFVDDEAERGWYELFNIIIEANNPHLYVDCLGKDDFVDKKQEEIVDLILDKVRNDDFNIVILDFRLHQNDFVSDRIEDITGYQALCKIKEYNQGIQVIIFSATNKVWNLQELQRKDANGFIIKESPYNSKDGLFTQKTINLFIEAMSDAVNNIFKKNIFEKCSKMLSVLSKYNYDSEKYEKAIKAFYRQIELMIDSIPRVSYKDKNSVDITFVSGFNVFEILKDSFLREEKFRTYFIGESDGNVFKIEESNSKKKIHRMQSPTLINTLFKQKGEYVRPSLFDFMGSLLIYLNVAKCHIRDGELEKMWDIVNWRNDFIHGTKPHFSREELLTLIDVLELISLNIKP